MVVRQKEGGQKKEDTEKQIYRNEKRQKDI